MSANNQSMTRQVEQDRRILELLSQSFPNAAAASTEIINLEAILNLPKGTEHFVADIHGEHEAFQHILKNASGTIKRKIKERYDETLTKEEIRELCTLIYYPEEKLELVTAAEDDLTTWYETTLFRLIEVCRIISSKYTRSKVRKALPQEFAYILEELLHENAEDKDKGDYIHRIIETVISTEQAGNIIKALCHVIQRLAIDQLHILGDVFDRGPGALQELRHTVGQPRRPVDGRRRRQRLLHHERAAPLAALRQHGHAGRRIRHQPRAAGHLRHGAIRRRPLPGIHAKTR